MSAWEIEPAVNKPHDTGCPPTGFGLRGDGSWIHSFQLERGAQGETIRNSNVRKPHPYSKDRRRV